MSINRFTLLLVTALSCMVGYAQADNMAKLVLPEVLNPLFVDGEKHTRGLFNTGDMVFELSPGRHQVVVEYEKIWESGDEYDRVVSEPVMVTFTAEAGQTYRLKTPTLTNVNASKAFAKLPSLTLFNPNANSKVDAQLSYQLEQQSFLGSFVKEEAKSVTGEKTQPAGGESEALKQLQHWWQQANKEERAEFMQWIVE